MRVVNKLTATVRGLEGVCLFGSVARGDAADGSDIDLLIFGSDATLTPAAILRTLPAALRPGVSVTYCQLAHFHARFRRRPDFIAHIRQESEPLYDRDGAVRRMLARAPEDVDIGEGLTSCLRQLELYRNLRPYRSNYLFCLAHLYAIGRGVVSLALTGQGTPRFNRDQAFARFGAMYPDLGAEVRSVMELQPFYALVSGRHPERLPFSYKAGADAARRAVSAIEKVACAVGRS